MTNSPVRISVTTPDVAQLALGLRTRANELESWIRAATVTLYRTASIGHAAEVLSRAKQVETELRRSAEDTAKVALSYLAGDDAARAEFLSEWGGWPSGVTVADVLGGALAMSGVAWGVAAWLTTGATAWWAFSRPSATSVTALRGAASLLGLSVSGVTAWSVWFSGSSARPENARAGPTAAVARGLTQIVGMGDVSGGLRVIRAESFACRAPAGFADIVARIPRAGAGDPQVRIDRLGSTVVVYIGGTVDGGLDGVAEPWDMGSNISALAGATSDSEEAVRAALVSAGVTTSDRLILVGHSQGGLVAQRLAADARWNVTDVITVGSPVQPDGIPASVRVTTIENANDPIPALGGFARSDARDVSVRSTTETPATNDSLAAHHISEYLKTAAAMDASNSTALASMRRELGMTPDQGCQASMWRIDRSRSPSSR